MWLDFEGIDGSGKTTVSTRLAEELRRRGRTVVHAREGGRFASPISGRVRDLVRSVDSLFLAPETELLLNLAREAQLVAEIVRPALARGAWVITDRTIYSHAGLARYVRGLAREAVEAAAGVAAQGLRPDRVFFIDVDPDVARWRRRLRKVRERRFNDEGRKGLLGESLAWRTRRAFQEFARAEGWIVVENTWRTLDETMADVLAAAEGRPRPPEPRSSFEADPEDLVGSFLAFARSLEDPSLGALLAAGLDDPRADELRRSAPDDIAAFSLGGMDTDGSWDLRERLKTRVPFHVARSLAGLGPHRRAWALRRELEAEAPDQVLHSLAGETGPEAHALRRRHWDGAREEALRSLRGVSDETSWEFRRSARLEAPSAALAESLGGVDAPLAWEIRAELRDAHLLPVTRSLKGLDHPEAWSLRRAVARAAPKVALATIEGLGGPEAEALRDELRELSPDETASSLAHLDTPEAWRRRLEMKDGAPAGVIKSLRGLDRDRAAPLVSEIVRRHPRRLRVAREAAQFLLRKPCPAYST